MIVGNSMKSRHNKWLDVLLIIARDHPMLTPFQVVVTATLSQGWIPNSVTRARIQRSLDLDDTYKSPSAVLAVSSKIKPKLENLKRLEFLEGEIFLDLSTSSKQNVITGIQRIVNSIYPQNGTLKKTAISKSGMMILDDGFTMPKLAQQLNLIGSGVWHRWVSNLVIGIRSEKFQQLVVKIIASIRELLAFGYTHKEKRVILVPINCTWNLMEVAADTHQIDFLEFLLDADMIKMKVLFHDLIPLTHPELCPPDPRGNFLRYLKLTSRAFEVICISNDVKLRYDAYLTMLDSLEDNQCVRVLPYPVSPLIKKKGNLSKPVKKFLNLNRPYLIATGGFTRRKNLGIVIGALALEPISLDLVIVGNNQWGADYISDELKIWQRVANRVHLFPNVTDVDLNFLLQNASALVYPSLAEGFGLPILEGISYGLPVLTSDLEPMRSITKDLICINPHHLKDWSRSILELSISQETNMNLKYLNHHDDNETNLSYMWSAWTQQFFCFREEN